MERGGVQNCWRSRRALSDSEINVRVEMRAAQIADNQRLSRARQISASRISPTLIQHRQRTALDALRVNGPMAPSALARVLDVKHQTAISILAGLAFRGLIVREGEAWRASAGVRP